MKSTIRNRERKCFSPRRRSSETLESRRVLAAIPFVANAVFDSGIGQSQMVEAGDFNGDSNVDAVALAGRQVVLFQNLDGQANFSEPTQVTEELAGETRSIIVGDYDGDRDLDFIVGVRIFSDNAAITLHTNDGAGSFSVAAELATGTVAPFVDALESGDLDGDGDLDFVAVARGDETRDAAFLVYNNNGDGSFSDPVNIVGDFPEPRAAHFVDIDGDNDLDIVGTTSVEATGDHRLFIFENDGAGNFSLNPDVLDSPGAEPRFLSSGDFDGDEDQDLAVPHQEAGLLVIYENDGTGRLGENQIIEGLPNIERTKVADLDSDGDDDIIATLDTPGFVIWFENADGAFDGDQPLIVSDDVDSASGIAIADLNGDSRLDLFASSQFSAQVHTLVNDGQTVFEQQTLTPPNIINPNSALPADLDGDGDLDVLSWSETDYELAWFENTDGQGTFGTQNLIADFAAPPNTTIWWDVEVGDMDGDGDLDVVATEPIFDQLLWYENTDGKGTFDNVNVFNEDQFGVLEIEIVDMDNDNDNDIVTAHFFAEELVWYENVDGLGDLARRTIANLSLTRAETAVGDIDNDGDVDILVGDDAPMEPRSVTWYENVDGIFDEVQILKTDVFNIDDVKLADMDADGDLDAFTAAWPDNMGNSRLEWFENTDGAGTFSEVPNLVGIQLTAEELLLVDVDGDGDVDVAGPSPNEGLIEWFENTNGIGTAWDEHVVDREIFDLGEHMGAGDINGDGKLDFVAAHGVANQVIWYDPQDDTDINDDGTTDITDVHSLCTDIRNGVNSYDATGDDVTNINDMVALMDAAFTSVMGDSDLNGSFGTRDLVRVFEANEYEDGIPGNSNWSTGDWNCDGDFTSSDLVLVFELDTFDPDAVAAIPSTTIAAAVNLDAQPEIDDDEPLHESKVNPIVARRMELNDVRVDLVFSDLADVMEEDEETAFVA